MPWPMRVSVGWVEVLGIPPRSRCPHRHQPSGTRVARHSDGSQKLELLLDRTLGNCSLRCPTSGIHALGRQAHRHCAKPDRHLPPARHRSLHLPGRCPPARRPTPRSARRRTHPTAVEATIRRQSAEIGLAHDPAIGKDAGELPLTACRGMGDRHGVEYAVHA